MRRLYVQAMSCYGAMLVLAGCDAINFTSIQYKYEQQRDECRELSEMKYELYRSGGGGAANARDVSSSLTALYNDCMYNQGWNIAPPAKESEAAKAPRLRQNVN
jgi:hypothetical protein